MRFRGLKQESHLFMEKKQMSVLSFPLQPVGKQFVSGVCRLFLSSCFYVSWIIFSPHPSSSLNALMSGIICRVSSYSCQLCGLCTVCLWTVNTRVFLSASLSGSPLDAHSLCSLSPGFGRSCWAVRVQTCSRSWPEKVNSEQRRVSGGGGRRRASVVCVCVCVLVITWNDHKLPCTFMPVS